MKEPLSEINNHNMQYKVISLLQPWATLVVMGAKRIETRSWNTNYRGELLIHASQRFNKEQAKAMAKDPAFDIIGEAGYDWRPWGKPTTLPLGAIIGSVNLVDTFQFSKDAQSQLQAYGAEQNPWIPYREGGNDFESLEEEDEWQDNIIKELAFGDYSPGRYGWLLSNPVMFDRPIPAKGSQGFWKPDEATSLLITEQLLLSEV